jgi:hypothetical protein
MTVFCFLLARGGQLLSGRLYAVAVPPAEVLTEANFNAAFERENEARVYLVCDA